MKSGKIRCADVVCAPGVYKDPNSGKLSGIMVDAMTKAAEKLQLEAEFVEEVGWGTMNEGLLTDRYDVALFAFKSATRGRVVDFSAPLFYSAINAYGRPDEKRFISGTDSMNDPSVLIATVDGEMSSMIAARDFPRATQVTLPQMTDLSQMLLNVSTGKADLAFVEVAVAEEFLKKNPNTIENLTPARPIKVMPNAVLFKQNEHAFKAMLNLAFEELLNSGYIDSLIKKYEPLPNVIDSVALPYQTSRN
jgi:ABC-type amino acid transport substrate-binding protein